MIKGLSTFNTLDNEESRPLKAIFIEKTKAMLWWGNDPQMHELFALNIDKSNHCLNELTCFIQNEI